MGEPASPAINWASGEMPAWGGQSFEVQIMRDAPGEQSSGLTPAHEDMDVTLSPRQTECLFWVQQGKSSRDIGTILGVSHRIVERHVFRACRKLGVRTRIQAVVRARSLGLIRDPPRREGSGLS
jgi:LuxR family quorum-sensing system transcriptional regulator CciR